MYLYRECQTSISQRALEQVSSPRSPHRAAARAKCHVSNVYSGTWLHTVSAIWWQAGGVQPKVGSYVDLSLLSKLGDWVAASNVR